VRHSRARVGDGRTIEAQRGGILVIVEDYSAHPLPIKARPRARSERPRLPSLSPSATGHVQQIRVPFSRMMMGCAVRAAQVPLRAVLGLHANTVTTFAGPLAGAEDAFKSKFGQASCFGVLGARLHYCPWSVAPACCAGSAAGYFVQCCVPILRCSPLEACIREAGRFS
jgi:hypothetical protein